MARVENAAHDGIYQAAEAVRDQALRVNRSLFTRSRRVWGDDLLGDLRERLAVAPSGTFDQTWAAALDGAEPAVVQLAAEVCYVHALFPADLRPRRKRGLVYGTLARSPVAPRVPSALDAALDGGIAGTGVAYKRRRLSQLRFLLEAALALKTLPRRQREAVLDDPWATKETLAGIPPDGGQAQREALLHLLHPDTFEAIVSVPVKQRILAAHAHVLPGTGGDLDAELLTLRGHLAPEHGEGFSWGAAPLDAAWRG